MTAVPLFWTNPEQLESDCKVIECRQTEKNTGTQSLYLERSPIYPGGGGQAPDKATIDGRELVTSGQDNRGLYYDIQSQKQYAPGDLLPCVVDAEFRRDSCQQHSGQHLVSAALLTEGLQTVSVHMGKDYCGIEVDGSEPDEKVINRVLELCDSWIRSEKQIISSFFSSAEELPSELRRPLSTKLSAPEEIGNNASQSEATLRVVSIEGIDAVGCGGVHLKHTGSIVSVLYDGFEKIRGRTRLKWIIGDRVIERARILSRTDRELCTLMSSETEFLLLQVSHILLESRESRKALSLSEKKLGALMCRTAAQEKSSVAICIEGGSDRINGALEEAVARDIEAGFFLGDRTLEGRRPWGFFSRGDDSTVFEEFLSSVISPAGGKGGGRPPLWRGTVAGEEESLLSACIRLFNQ